MRRVEKIYLVTHRYDLNNLFVCLASIKYWYPNMEIVVIKNLNNGSFDIDFLKKYYKVSFRYESDFSYGKFYGSLEPFISGKNERFISIDTDTALTGKIIDFIETRDEDFVLDYEVQPENKIKSLYWDPALIGNYVNCYSGNWFTFNNGIMGCTADKITVADFIDFMVWEPKKEPVIIDSAAFPTYDQSAINVVINKKFVQKQITVARQEIMIYPPQYTDSEEQLLMGIVNRNASEYRVIHWADTKNFPPGKKPLEKIFDFYLQLFYKDLTSGDERKIKSHLRYLQRESIVKYWISPRLKKLKRLFQNR